MSTTPTHPSIEQGEQAIPEVAPPPLDPLEPEGQDHPVDLGRIAWLATVFVCLVTVAILLLKGYAGYAVVTFAVALSAAVNLR